MNALSIILIILSVFIIVSLLMIIIDNIFTYLFVKSLTLDEINDNINKFDEAISSLQEKDEDIGQIDILLDQKELWLYYFKVKKKQLKIKG